MDHRTELFVALQRILPKHFLSRAIAKLAESKYRPVKNWLIKRAIKTFNITLSYFYCFNI